MLYDHFYMFIFQSALPELRGMYLNSLDLGEDYVRFLLERVHSDDVDVPIAVSFSMLGKKIFATNYECEIAKRNRSQQDSSAETAGFTKATLFLAAFFAVAAKILPKLDRVSSEDVQHLLSTEIPSIPGFADLSRDLQSTSVRFININVMDVLRQFTGSTSVDAKDLADNISGLVELDNHNAFHKRGAQTARDTFLLYCELISRIPPRWFR